MSNQKKGYFVAAVVGQYAEESVIANDSKKRPHTAQEAVQIALTETLRDEVINQMLASPEGLMLRVKWVENE